LATARRHLDFAPKLQALADQLATTRLALVHGDISPKNILCGPAGPVFIDAECATFGDPAFDIAFLLNHLVIKAMVVDSHRMALVAAATKAWRAYQDGIEWEAAETVERRVIALLPALMLARVDGKSPLDYLDERSGSVVRDRARQLLAEPPVSLEAIIDLKDMGFAA
jgi:aminoglycoside phosphotransferase (APT) family kinase protein